MAACSRSCASGPSTAILCFVAFCAVLIPTLAFTPAIPGVFTSVRLRRPCHNQGFLRYNKHIAEKKPAVLFIQQAAEEAPATDAPTDEASASETTVDELEEDWKAAEDPSSGRVYYWNTKTREVSWYKPARKVKGLARALLDDTEDFTESLSEAESSEEGDRERTAEELAAKRERREKRRQAAQERAQRMQTYLTDTEASRERKNLERSPTKMVADELSVPKAPQISDQVVSLIQSARGEQPSLQDQERQAYIAWLDKAYDELAPEEDATGISLPGLLLKREVDRGDVLDFDMRVKLARDPQKALETATERALQRGQEAAARALAEAQGVAQQTAQEALIEAARSGAKVGEAVAEESKGLWSKLFGRKKKAEAPPAEVTAMQAQAAAAPEAEATVEVEAAEEVAVPAVEQELGYPEGAFEYSIAGQSGGQPKENQDTTLLAQIDAESAIYAVFDGHGPGGATVSQFVAEKLRESLAQVVRESKAAGLGKEQLKERVKTAFLDADNALSESLQDYCGLEFDGSTGCAVLRTGKDVLVAFVGDSSCVVGFKGGAAKRLTADHAPFKAEERYRIEASGGMVAAFPDEPPPEVSGKGRVFVADQMFPGLAVSRAFGDLVAKTVGVIAEPECVDYSAKGNEVLIVGSDGVWDVISNEEAVEICMKHLDKRDAVLATADLVEAARSRWEDFQQDFVNEGGDKASFSIDDISAVTVFL